MAISYDFGELFRIPNCFVDQMYHAGRRRTDADKQEQLLNYSVYEELYNERGLDPELIDDPLWKFAVLVSNLTVDGRFRFILEAEDIFELFAYKFISISILSRYFAIKYLIKKLKILSGREI